MLHAQLRKGDHWNQGLVEALVQPDTSLAETCDQRVEIV
jgi:hypothetical protein